MEELSDSTANQPRRFRAAGLGALEVPMTKQSFRDRVRFTKNEARDAGDNEMHQLCIRVLNDNLRLYDYQTGELVQLAIDSPTTQYVKAIGSSLDRTEYRPEGVTTYQSRSVYAATYQWSTTS